MISPIRLLLSQLHQHNKLASHTSSQTPLSLTHGLPLASTDMLPPSRSAPEAGSTSEMERKTSLSKGHGLVAWSASFDSHARLRHRCHAYMHMVILARGDLPRTHETAPRILASKRPEPPTSPSAANGKRESSSLLAVCMDKWGKRGVIERHRIDNLDDTRRRKGDEFKTPDLQIEVSDLPPG